MKFKDMEMHTGINIDNGSFLMRVPGGLIYTDYSDLSQSSVFVPACQDFELEMPGTEKENDN